jgi:hypothetical protein
VNETDKNKGPGFYEMKAIPLEEQLLADPTIIKGKYISGRSNTITNLPFSALSFDAVDELASTELILSNKSIDGADNTLSNIDSDSLNYGSGIWWEEIGRTTLSGSADTISVTGLPVRKYLQVRLLLYASGAIATCFRFNNDSANNYAYRYMIDGLFGVVTSQASVNSVGTTSVPQMGVIDIVNVAGQVKLGKWVQPTAVGGTSAATAPSYVDFWWKWVNATDAITQVDIFNSGAGDFTIGSEVVVLGHD